jgi:hypothetical protein
MVRDERMPSVLSFGEGWSWWQGKDCLLGRANPGKQKWTPERTHCARRGRWYSCGYPGQLLGTPHLRCGVLAQSTRGSASECSRAHRLTICSTGSSCHPLDRETDKETGREETTQSAWGSQPQVVCQCVWTRQGGLAWTWVHCQAQARQSAHPLVSSWP